MTARPGTVVALVSLGGAAGSVARLALSEAIGRAPGSFPWATFTANVSGAFLLGLLLGLVVAGHRPAWRARALLGTGVLGSFTTFSALAVETDLLVRDGEVLVAGTYLLATLAFGTAAAAIGARLPRPGSALRQADVSRP